MTRRPAKGELRWAPPQLPSTFDSDQSVGICGRKCKKLKPTSEVEGAAATNSRGVFFNQFRCHARKPGRRGRGGVGFFVTSHSQTTVPAWPSSVARYDVSPRAPLRHALHPPQNSLQLSPGKPQATGPRHPHFFEIGRPLGRRHRQLCRSGASRRRQWSRPRLPRHPPPRPRPRLLMQRQTRRPTATAPLLAAEAIPPFHPVRCRERMRRAAH